MTWHTWTHVYTSHRHYYCSRHGFTYIRGWMQMVLAPNDLFSWNNNTISTMLMKVSTYFVPSHLVTSRLPASPVQTQLTLTDPNWGPRSPHPQSGVPFHRVSAHSLSRVQNNYSSSSLHFFHFSWQACWYRPFPSDTRRTAEYLTERKQNMDRRTAETWSEE
jgi:hypothetical protein